MTLEGPDALRKRMNQDTEKEAAQEARPYHSFEFDREFRGQRFHGKFTSRVPTIGDQIEVGRLKAMYLPNGSTADPNAGLLVEAICYLEVVLEEKPNWWQPTKLMDTDIVLGVYKEVIAYANKFLKGEAADSEDAEKADGVGDTGGVDDPDPSSVDGAVQPPPKRLAIPIIDDRSGDGAGAPSRSVG